MCTVLLPPGGYPIAVYKHIYIYINIVLIDERIKFNFDERGGGVYWRIAAHRTVNAVMINLFCTKFMQVSRKLKNCSSLQQRRNRDGVNVYSSTHS